MQSKFLIIILLVLTCLKPSETTASELVPITNECFHAAAEYYEVPVAALYGIFAQEAGTVGEYEINKNKSRDNGPMQINSIWNNTFESMNISEQNIRNHGCLNVFISAYILKDCLNATGDIWQAIGRYHSKKAKYAEPYKRKVLNKLLTVKDYDLLIAKANKHVGGAK